MKAMVLDRPRTALVLVNRPDPTPGPGEIRVRVEACVVCRTDLHVVDGELPCPKSPLVPGHEIVGVVDLIGEGVAPSRLGQRVGIPCLDTHVGAAATARVRLKTSATNLCLPVTRAMAVLPVTSSQMMPSHSISTRLQIRWHWHRCCALASLVGAA